MPNIIIKIENGIAIVLDTPKEKEFELAKKNHTYRIVSASEDYMVIDYDKDQARPYVKALLAKVNKLREIKILYFCLALLIINSLMLAWQFVISTYKLGQALDKIDKLPTTSTIEKAQKDAREMQNSIVSPKSDFSSMSSTWNTNKGKLFQ